MCINVINSFYKMDTQLSAKTASPKLFAKDNRKIQEMCTELCSYNSMVSNETEKLSFTLDMAKLAYGQTVHSFDFEKSCNANFDLVPEKKATTPQDVGQDLVKSDKETAFSDEKISFPGLEKKETQSNQNSKKLTRQSSGELKDKCRCTRKKVKTTEGVNKTQYKGILKKYIQ
jgi:hypothetical protein